ncbi:hypothetical protein OsI_36977 [Oryza sativa Indica Group]|uniref:Uncharacterized protein n=1 Tax=Oryza sativa subsp. indica TaxID=39946 RepID=B8BIH5_ORYSI|nr:hypothetical protein OsI_36977 [Oryza sativa Indica Group]
MEPVHTKIEAFGVRSRDIAGLKEDGEHDNSADGMGLLLCRGKEERIHLFPSFHADCHFIPGQIAHKTSHHFDISVILYGEYGTFPKRQEEMIYGWLLQLGCEPVKKGCNVQPNSPTNKKIHMPP